MNPQLLITLYKIATWIIEQLIQRRAESTPQAKAQKIQQRRASSVGSLLGMLMFFIGTLVTSMFMCVDFVFAQDGKPVTDDQVNAVAKQLFCPICENIPLDVCPTQACAQWRDTIREKLAIGWSEDQIKDYFVQQYGERVLAKPRTTGLSLYVWVIPPAAILIGALFFIFYMRNARMKVAAAPMAASPENEEDDYAKKLEKELAKRG
ncbi:MAG: cytochrome c-type biogenesis protein CcmH [Chloroflexi bacterium]|nr:cytochrome c-type biogenesis protein CcmH [Chloroflexota bacterium]